MVPRLGVLLLSKAKANFARCQQRFDAKRRTHDHASPISRGDSVLMLVPSPAHCLQALALRLQGPYTVLAVSATSATLRTGNVEAVPVERGLDQLVKYWSPAEAVAFQTHLAAQQQQRVRQVTVGFASLF